MEKRLVLVQREQSTNRTTRERDSFTHAYLMSSVLKLDTIELMKFSRMITARIAFQSVAFSPNNKQIDSKANLTIAGGLAMERTSTRCCFLIDLTAVWE